MISTETDPGGSSPGVKRSTKKAKLGFRDDRDVGSTSVTEHRLEKKKKTKGEKAPMPEVAKTKGNPGEKEAGRDKKGKKKVTEIMISEGEDGDEAAEDNEQSPPLSDSEAGDGEYTPPVHESLGRASGPGSASSSKRSKKYVPPDETPDQRDSRTIFIGNVLSQVMATKVSWCRVSLPKMVVD